MEEQNIHLFMYKCAFDDEHHLYMGVVAKTAEEADTCEAIKNTKAQEGVTVSEPIDFNQVNLMELFPIYLVDESKSYNMAFGYHLEEITPQPEQMVVDVDESVLEQATHD